MESGKKPEIEKNTTFEEMEEEKRNAAIAAAYARYLIEHNLKPGDATFVDPEVIGVQIEDEKPEVTIDFDEDELDAALEKAVQIENGTYVPEIVAKPDDVLTPKKAKKQSSLGASIETALAAPVFLHDRIQEAVWDVIDRAYIDAYTTFQTLIATYKHSRRQIARTLIFICAMCAAILVLFDRFTIYEYAYNGKVLGYVEAQEDVTNVLDIAADKLNEVNSKTENDTQKITFKAGDNITFKLVEANNKDADDENATVNKLAYMTDIEVQATGIYDDGKLVTVVKNDLAAEGLLAEVKGILGTPDKGMEVVSVEYKNQLELKPVNVLLNSVQSNDAAKKQMSEGGETKFYHLVEGNETLDGIASTFSVNKSSIYDENNEKTVSSVEQGDKICIRKSVKPVSVELVETGKMKEIIEYKTIKKKTKDLYIGDEEVEVEGVNGVQIFDGTLTKVGGEVVHRKVKSLEIITKKVDKVVLVGTTKRPKTAPTGIFKNPMTPGTYIVTSRPGARWGRQHEGVDMGASTGTPIYASDGGTVIRASYFSGYGNCVEIQHKTGWITRYGHMSSYGVSVGDKVYQGQYIGAVGSTGRSTGPHLHFEIRRNGAFINPDTMVKGGL